MAGLTRFPGGINTGGLYEDNVGKAGLPGQQILRFSGDVVADNTVTIGGNVFRFKVINTDSTLDLATALVVEGFSNIEMAAHGQVGGNLIRIDNEIMEVVQVHNASRIRVRRGVSNTTVATHAAAASIFVEAAHTSGILVGVVATLTPAVAIPAFVEVFNRRYPSSTVRALNLVTTHTMNAIYFYTAGTDGVSAPWAGGNIAVSETLTNGAFDAANITDGRGNQNYVIIKLVPIAAEVTAGKIVRYFPFTPVVEDVVIRVTSTGAELAWDGAVTVVGRSVVLDNTGSVDWATTNTIVLTVRG